MILHTATEMRQHLSPCQLEEALGDQNRKYAENALGHKPTDDEASCITT